MTSPCGRRPARGFVQRRVSVSEGWRGAEVVAHHYIPNSSVCLSSNMALTHHFLAVTIFWQFEYLGIQHVHPARQKQKLISCRTTSSPRRAMLVGVSYLSPRATHAGMKGIDLQHFCGSSAKRLNPEPALFVSVWARADGSDNGEQRPRATCSTWERTNMTMR